MMRAPPTDWKTRDLDISEMHRRKKITLKVARLTEKDSSCRSVSI
jgi:hypothetical protein